MCTDAMHYVHITHVMRHTRLLDAEYLCVHSPILLEAIKEKEERHTINVLWVDLVQMTSSIQSFHLHQVFWWITGYRN